MIATYPKLFPKDISQGYKLHGLMPASQKMPQVQLRRIQLSACDTAGRRQVYTIAPCDILPYVVGAVTEVEKALFLRRFGGPFWALTYVFDHNDMYWYRLVGSLGRHDIVGTTVKEPMNLPEHLLADEKHARFHGEKVYIATIVAADCVLGASVSFTADAQGLTEAYGHFQQEAQRLDIDYVPKTVNTDGWQATHLAWQTLFTTVTIIQCFLHAFLKVRTCGKRLGQTSTEIKGQVWDIYHAGSRTDFCQKVSQLQDWTRTHADDLTTSVIEAIDKLCTNVWIAAASSGGRYKISWAKSSSASRSASALQLAALSAPVRSSSHHSPITRSTISSCSCNAFNNVRIKISQSRPQKILF
jgi:hypothetical protein